jgi:DNA invertase Pin-like site-specific DNA recombinase
MNTETHRQNRAVIYLRIGSPFLQDLHRVDLQRQGCRQIAAKHGLQIIREYTDVGTPAILERQTALLNLLEDLARQRDAAHVVMWDYSRAACTLEQLDAVERQLRNAEASVITLTGMEAAKRLISKLASE